MLRHDIRQLLASIGPLRRAVLRFRGDGATSDDHSNARWSAEDLGERSRLLQRAEAFTKFHELWPSPPTPVQLFGKPSIGSIPLIICLWNRPKQIDELLERIDAQVGVGGEPRPRLRLIFWNNCAPDQDWYEERIAAFRPTGAIDSIELVASPHNIRGVARFIVARWLYTAGVRGNFLMLDDDELIGPHALSELLLAGGERTIASFWSWRANPDDYWQRERALNGEEADYAATGGCVCDIELVADDEFFTALPELGLFIEDAWMSRLALSRGWNLRAKDIEVEFVLHETNQYGPLILDKVAFWSSLNEQYPLPKAEERRLIRNQ